MPKAQVSHHVGTLEFINKEFRVYWESFIFSFFFFPFFSFLKFHIKKFIKLISGYHKYHK